MNSRNLTLSNIPSFMNAIRPFSAACEPIKRLLRGFPMLGPKAFVVTHCMSKELRTGHHSLCIEAPRQRYHGPADFVMTRG
jgi:hypothetical protein